MGTASTSLSAPARVLIVSESLGDASVVLDVEAAGHDVIKVIDHQHAIEVIGELHPDAVIVEATAGTEIPTLELCRVVREHAGASWSAVFLVEEGPVSEAMRKEAWRAGVWHILESPVDPEELSLQIDLAVGVRRDAERAHTLSLVDAETGLYNSAGLARRTRELSAEAMRTRTALACIVISATVKGAAATRSAAARSAEVLRTLGRLSDIVGRVGPLEYIVLAPATSEEGAAQLARRLAVAYRVALIHALPAGAQVWAQAGCCSLANLGYAPLESADILSRASNALRSGPAAPNFEWVNFAEAEAQPSIA
ncbi:MAG TPA: hypothetical protein VF483_00305 [Gemmatimonadaceae bacterium]